MDNKDESIIKMLILYEQRMDTFLEYLVNRTKKIQGIVMIIYLDNYRCSRIGLSWGPLKLALK